MEDFSKVIKAEGSRLEIIGTTVIKSSDNKKRHFYICKCSCGNEKNIRKDAINKTKSCGCLTIEVANSAAHRERFKSFPRPVKPLENLVGKVFGRLTVIQLDEPRYTPKGRKLNYWLCSCYCGNTHSVESSGLRGGKVTSCGCVYPEYVYSSFTNLTECFIDKAVKVHGEIYDYSVTNYIHSKVSVDILCKTHGKFSINPANHLMGSGCKKCAFDEKRIGNDLFIKKSKDLFGDSLDYSFVDYVRSDSPVTLICSVHGRFEATPSNHLKSVAPCPECSKLARRKSSEEFLEEVREVHGDFYDYSVTRYTHCQEEVDVICRKHGLFTKEAGLFLQGVGCPACSGENRASKQHWNYIKRCEINPLLQGRKGFLYLLKMTSEDETFLKVGVSKEYKKRLTRYTEQALKFEVLKVVEFETTKESAIFEKSLLDFISNSNFRFIPTIKFKGWTECASCEFLQAIEDFIENRKVSHE